MTLDVREFERASTIFPFLDALTPELRTEFSQQAQSFNLSAGEFICLEGDACTHLVLLLEGRARVYKMGPSGREITLYRLSNGESCIMTASCILSQKSFPAFAVTETNVEAVGFPARFLQPWMTQDPAWQTYIFGLLSQRLMTVMDVIEEVAFQRMDSRIAAYLLRTSNGNGEIYTTHELIAQELGSSREVVS